MKAKNKKYNIYKTINLVNGRFYWGVHDSIDENDGYLGSGKILKQAIKKYGKASFMRKTMVTYETAADAYFDEGLLVTQKYLDENPLCYNIMFGGKGGSIKGAKRSEETRQKIRENHADISGKNHPLYGKTGENHPNYGKNYNVGTNNPNYGKLASKETKQKLRDVWVRRKANEV